MLSSIEQFRENIARVNDVGGFHTTLKNTTTAIVDLTDLLRAQIVMIVSALDLYIHEIARIGMLEVYNGDRPQTGAFLRFQVTLDSALNGISKPSVSDWLDTEIRERHGHLSFQDPDSIADAVRRFSSCELWPSVAAELNMDVSDVKNQLRAIIKRRNQIVHEADLMPSYPGTITRWNILPADVVTTLEFILNVCEAIDIVTKPIS
ncbi:hypothetical protein F4225_00835 [Candidatus Poribacteria bacterium]|nr:hypothetical protein [Candidatus Poribacteria bacterium]